jgi:hypothetical protein
MLQAGAVVPACLDTSFASKTRRGHMATSIIDGTLIDCATGRSRPGKFTIYKSLTFERADGSTEILKRQVVRADVADLLKPGVSGRFYTFKALDLKGIHGVRLNSGASVYSYHTGNLLLFPVLAVVNVAWIILMIFTRDAVPMLGVLMIGLAFVGYFITRRSMLETKEQFDSDNGEASQPPKDIARVITTAAPETG